MFFILMKNFDDFDDEDEKIPFLVYDDINKQPLTIKKTKGTRYFVSVEHYLNRDKKILSHLPNATYVIRDVNNELGLITQAPNVYEVLNHNTTMAVYSTKHDFNLPEKRKLGCNSFEFENENFPGSIKK